MRLNREQSQFYQIFCKLFFIAISKKLRLVVENPYGNSYLDLHFPIRPDVIDLDRRLLGDKFKKPTQYWFVGFKPYNNNIKLYYNIREFKFGYVKDKETCVKKGIHQCKSSIERSLITPEYANNFIRKYLVK